MSETQFTPGPWIVNPFVAQIDCEKISDKGGLLPVCQMLWPTDERTEAETEATAHLIAAAPDTYAGCAKAAAKFREYEALHRAKGTADADAKADANAAMAAELEAICARARGES